MSAEPIPRWFLVCTVPAVVPTRRSVRILIVVAQMLVVAAVTFAVLALTGAVNSRVILTIAALELFVLAGAILLNEWMRSRMLANGVLVDGADRILV